MSYELIIEPEAALDLQQALNWYDEQRPGLGREFIEQVDEVFSRIREMPKLHSVTYRSTRLALVRRFPYVVCYLFDGNVVYVLAVFHGHRDPSSWQDRLR
ncbi:type II toxin-antitoxin system RelE/ParE family toxin [Pirellulales bacterium]|nr:type II toxin-antitoxin system RelE/ParE family toxin [Pirellulales bacterium]